VSKPITSQGATGGSGISQLDRAGTISLIILIVISGGLRRWQEARRQRSPYFPPVTHGLTGR